MTIYELITFIMFFILFDSSTARQAGVVTGDLAWSLLQHAKERRVWSLPHQKHLENLKNPTSALGKEHKYAIPAFNCTSSRLGDGRCKSPASM